MLLIIGNCSPIVCGGMCLVLVLLFDSLRPSFAIILIWERGLIVLL